MTNSVSWKTIEGKVTESEVGHANGDYIYYIESRGRIYEIILKSFRRDLKPGVKVMVTGVLTGSSMLASECKKVTERSKSSWNT